MTRALVIEDDEQVRTLICTYLEEAGCEVTHAAGGKDGVQRYQQEHPDLLITDILMPDKDGLEVITELYHQFPDARILAISGGGRSDAEDYLRPARMLGAVRSLREPFGREALLQAVEELALQPRPDESDAD